MRLPIPVVVGLALAREIVRALAVPLHAALYFVRREAAQRHARELLAHWQAAETGDALASFLRRHPPRAPAVAHVFVSAGEASGESHAAGLMSALQADGGARIRFSCFGGDAMRAAGGEVLVPLSRHAIMGVSGVLRSLPFVLRTFARFVRMLRQDRPDLVVLVDYPGLHLVMARAARRAGVPVLHYIAPQYWAWAPWRLARYRRCVDACLAILPFEPAFFRSSGVPCEYVGNPVLDALAEAESDRMRVAELSADRWLCLLPGSRRSELERHLPGMLRVARRLRAADPEARVLVAHRDPLRQALIREILAREGADFVQFEVGGLTEKLTAARVALVKSGTGSLEAALLGTPAVVVYRVGGRIMSFAYRHFLSVPWFAAANLVAARSVVPEWCFHDERVWDSVAADVERLWHPGADRLQCLDQLADIPHRLGTPGASRRAAQWVLAALGYPAENRA